MDNDLNIPSSTHRDGAVDDAIIVYTALLNHQGNIIAMNSLWAQAAQNPEHPLLAEAVLGADYPLLIERTTLNFPASGQEMRQNIQNVLDGTLPLYLLEYGCPIGREERRYLLQVTPSMGAPGALVSHTDISTLRCTERRLREHLAQSKKALQDALAHQAHLEAVNVSLAKMATMDGLTALKNHRAFQEHLRQEFERARRYSSELSLVLLDIDHFKLYNDTFGHPAGDMVLVQIAQLLSSLARETDFIARYGGEEFTLILPNTDSKGAVAMAQRFRAAAEFAPWPKRVVTASFGIASLSPGTSSPAQLVAEADAALYAAKQAGRNRVRHYLDLPAERDSF